MLRLRPVSGNLETKPTIRKWLRRVSTTPNNALPANGDAGTDQQQPSEPPKKPHDATSRNQRIQDAARSNIEDIKRLTRLAEESITSNIMAQKVKTAILNLSNTCTITRQCNILKNSDAEFIKANKDLIIDRYIKTIKLVKQENRQKYRKQFITALHLLIDADVTPTPLSYLHFLDLIPPPCIESEQNKISPAEMLRDIVDVILKENKYTLDDIFLAKGAGFSDSELSDLAKRIENCDHGHGIIRPIVGPMKGKRSFQEHIATLLKQRCDSTYFAAINEIPPPSDSKRAAWQALQENDISSSTKNTQPSMDKPVWETMTKSKLLDYLEVQMENGMHQNDQIEILLAHTERNGKDYNFSGLIQKYIFLANPGYDKVTSKDALAIVNTTRSLLTRHLPSTLGHLFNSDLRHDTYDLQKKLEATQMEFESSVHASKVALSAATSRGQSNNIMDGKLVTFTEILHSYLANQFAAALNDFQKCKLDDENIIKGTGIRNTVLNSLSDLEIANHVMSAVLAIGHTNGTNKRMITADSIRPRLIKLLTDLSNQIMTNALEAKYGYEEFRKMNDRYNALVDDHLMDTFDANSSVARSANPINKTRLTPLEATFVTEFNQSITMAQTISPTALSSLTDFFLVLLKDHVTIDYKEFGKAYADEHLPDDFQQITSVLFKLESKISPFVQRIISMDGLTNYVVALNSDLESLIQKCEGAYTKISHLTMPMVHPPKKFLNDPNCKAGYLTKGYQLVANGNASAANLLLSQDNYKQMSEPITAVNNLSALPWEINKKALGVLLAILGSGGIENITQMQIADIPIPDDLQGQARFLLEKQNELRAQNRDTLTRALIVSTYFSRNTIYFPHFLDFRGRMYPSCSALSYQERDFIRGLLLFKEPKRLGKDGLRWLKIHASNLFGNDKVPLDMREKFIDENIDIIKDIAKNPLGSQHVSWWQSSDSPIQLLSACFEITNALNLKNSEDYLSKLPVHQDGSCNGLQHYCALGLDILGAEQVNLFGYGDTPNDIYKYVSGLVSEQVEKDKALLEAKGEFGYPHLVKTIDRKLVKRPVMTSVYGVKLYGANLQIQGEFKKNLPHYLDKTHLDKVISKFSRPHFENLSSSTASLQNPKSPALKSTSNVSVSMHQKQVLDSFSAYMSLASSSHSGSHSGAHSGAMFDAGTMTQGAYEKFLDPSEAPNIMRAMRKIEDQDQPNVFDFNYTAQDDASNISDVSLAELAVADSARPLDSSFMDAEAYKRDKLRNLAVNATCAYLAKVTLEKIGTAFTLSTNYQHWLMKCSDIITKKQNLVRWYTPTRFEVVQQYYKGKGTFRPVNKMVTRAVLNNEPIDALKFPVDPIKNKNAISPNYIHSMDSSHMMRTLNACTKKKVTMASVHDSYWTHASTIDAMNVTLREEFVKLYEDDNIAHLKDQFELFYNPSKNKEKAPLFPRPPTRGYFDLDVVKDSSYFFH